MSAYNIKSTPFPYDDRIYKEGNTQLSMLASASILAPVDFAKLLKHIDDNKLSQVVTSPHHYNQVVQDHSLFNVPASEVVMDLKSVRTVFTNWISGANKITAAMKELNVQHMAKGSFQNNIHLPLLSTIEVQKRDQSNLNIQAVRKMRQVLQIEPTKIQSINEINQLSASPFVSTSNLPPIFPPFSCSRIPLTLAPTTSIAAIHASSPLCLLQPAMLIKWLHHYSARSFSLLPVGIDDVRLSATKQQFLNPSINQTIETPNIWSLSKELINSQISQLQSAVRLFDQSTKRFAKDDRSITASDAFVIVDSLLNALRLFGDAGIAHVQNLPVSQSALSCMNVNAAASPSSNAKESSNKEYRDRNLLNSAGAMFIRKSASATTQVASATPVSNESTKKIYTADAELQSIRASDTITSWQCLWRSVIVLFASSPHRTHREQCVILLHQYIQMFCSSDLNNGKKQQLSVSDQGHFVMFELDYLCMILGAFSRQGDLACTIRMWNLIDSLLKNLISEHQHKHDEKDQSFSLNEINRARYYIRHFIFNAYLIETSKSKADTLGPCTSRQELQERVSQIIITRSGVSSDVLFEDSKQKLIMKDVIDSIEEGLIAVVSA
jgi:hypothetical protein